VNSVEVQSLSVQYGSFTAVDKISFSVIQGEIFGFLGANGAGKTTTIRVLCGLLPPTQGQVKVGGIDVRSYPLEVKKRIGYMSQKFTLYDDLTVVENLFFAASLRKLDGAQFRKSMEKLLSFIHFQQSPHSMVRDLSGGVRQQVSLVAALLHDPEIIFLDEPTAGVSPAYRKRFWDLIRLLAKERKTIFVTTHYMDEAENCDRLAFMDSGRVLELDSSVNLKMKYFNSKDPEQVHLEEAFIAAVENGRKK